MKLNKTDMIAIKENNGSYLLNKGAKFYRDGKYDEAIFYYNLAATMGEYQAASNLGYCYLYRTNPTNPELALAYFEIAANSGVIDAICKLGDIYKKGEIVLKDDELALYYYNKAIEILDMEHDYTEKLHYPSLYLALAKEYMPGGYYPTNLELAYAYLLFARDGYELEIENGCDYYEDTLRETEKYLADEMFEDVRYMFDDEMLDDEI